MTKLLQSNKRLAALIIALFMGFGTAQAAYDFAAACATGQTLYYQITDFTNYYVSIVAPGNSSEWWPENTVKPANMIAIPQTVSYYGIDFTVTSIANNAFYTCDGLTILLQVPNTVTSIGNHAFYGCSSLRIANIPNTINSIGNYAFYGCNSLTSITIPNLITSIGDHTFYGCSGLTSIEIPNSVTSIGNYAFCGCIGLTSITVGATTPPSVGDLAFDNVSKSIPVYVLCESVNDYQTATGWSEFTNIQRNGSIICFADLNVKAICVANWDTNGDGELNYEEAAAVTTLNPSGQSNQSVFRGNTDITSFDELQYFTGLSTIENCAFYDCSGLTSIEIPNSVTSIGNSAFRNCTGLTSIEIPNSVTSIRNGVFNHCTGLTSVEIPNSVTSIGNFAFNGCTGLTSIEIPNSVTSIGNSAFHGCTGLTSVEIPNSVTSIGEYAFYYCTGLTSVEIPNSVTSIGNYAFYGCSGLTSIEIPNSVTSIGNTAFNYCSGLATMVVASGNTTYDSRDNCNAIIETATNTLVAGCKNTLIPNSVTSIGECAFDGCTGLTSIEIPNSVSSIGNSAFFYCSGLTSIEIPNSVTYIGNQAFNGCSGLTSIEIPNSVTSIGNEAFRVCTGLTSITVQAETPPSLGNNAFIYVNNSIPVYVPCGTNSAYRSAPGWKNFNNYIQLGCGIIFADANVKAICLANWDTNGDGELSYDEAAAVTDLGFVFQYNDQITSFNELQYFTGLSAIENYAFYYCSGLTSIEIPNSLTSIGDYAFYYCSGLTSVEIPNSVTSIGDYAFYYCTGLTSVEIPNSVTSIGYKAFDGCSGLTSIEIPNSVTSIGHYAFQNCTGLTSVEIPNSVTSIGYYAFAYCCGLTSVEIPNSLTSIGNEAFCGCTGLTSIEIPNSVTSIGESAFAFCGGLTSIIVRAETPPALGWDVFYAVPTDIRVLVPCGFEEAYTSISWGGFSNIHGMCDGTVTATANPTEGGTISGTGPYEGGATCTLTATANEGYGFANWTENGSVVSTEAEYNFTVAGNRDLVANFASTDPIVFADDNVKAMCVANWDTDDDGELSYAEAAAVTDIGQVFRENNTITSFNELQYFVNLTSIGDWAFYNCTALTSIEIPYSVTSIRDYAFLDCSGLISIEIPNSVTSIGWYAFGNCPALTSIEIPNSVTSISRAFEGCTGLTQIVVENGNSVYDSRDNCNAIIETATNSLIAGCKTTVIPNTVTSIGDYAFHGCSGLTSIEIPNSVTSIGWYAFGNCSALTSIEIPNSVTSIGSWAFEGCTGLTQIVVENGNSVYDSRDNCNAIIETATNSLIAGCKTTVIPNTVTSIGDYAFHGCSGLTSIEIPNSVTSIGEYAFLYCSGLTEITMLRTDVPTLSWGAFYETNDCPIYVPYESLNNYKTTENWSEYEYRIYPMAYIAVSGYGTGGGKWKFIASPLTDNTEPTAVSNMTGTEYDLYRFNQSAELEWENYKVHDFDLVNEQGYLYANTEDVNLVFKGTFNEGSSQTITLIYDEGKDFAGWNLVGNPFPVQAYANRSYYTMNAAGTVIEPTAASTSTAIPACTGVMVKAETTGQSVTFSKTAPSAATNNGALQIAVAQANTRGAAVQDKAIVSFNAGDELGKFYFGESNAKLYIPQNGKELAIAYVCTDAARHVSTNEVPLNFKAEKNGEYTLSFDVANVIASEAKQSNLSEQFAYLHLIDNMNGADVDLLVSPEYTFNAKTSDYASRFRLVFSANESDGDNDGDNAFAFIDAGGNIVINGEGTLQVIDVTGRVIVSRDGVHTVSTNGMVPGMYILRLINGKNVMTQKIVIE